MYEDWNKEIFRVGIMDLLYILLALSLAGLFLSGRSFVKLYRGQGNGCAPIFAALIIIGSLWLLGFVVKEWNTYRTEKELVADFCRSHPRFKVYITPEELRDMTDDKAIWYRKKQASVFDNEKLGFNDVIYKISFSNQGQKDILIYSNYKFNRHSGFIMTIYVDSRYKIILFEENEASVSANYGTSSLGLKSWFNTIPDCDKPVKEGSSILNEYFSIYRGNKR